MRASVVTSWAPRAGSDIAQFEDAFWPRANGPRHARRLRFAVADGAGESMLSGLWADLLVRTWCKARRRPLPHILRLAAGAWEVELAAYLEEREREARPIEWFEEPGLARGAFATLLGLAFATAGADQHAGGWRAVSVGDSCLFQVRERSLLSAFPIKSADEFDTMPALVASRPGEVDHVLEHVDEYEGDWCSGDRFYLMTDAAAAWFLRTLEAGGQPWDVLDHAALGRSGFGAWVAERRRSRDLRNDDVTVVQVDVL